ncbi:TetR/AcrR family transcriptional regulator [Maricaulis sp.]|uniref:TetR/AcrR family transcriptional regulator n=1 Tax=Maricaulis sp. TaxID=1486257 RepID=UPI003A9286AB|tara:strand:- start:5411 stop:6112 length:702 start_codon:yes stop_codon:yes gene_type:complete
MANARRPSGEARESAIIAAATAIYLESGYAGAKMSEIAKRAGIAEGTLYLYFRNKHALMLGVVAEHWSELTRGAQASLRHQRGYFERVEALARYHLTSMIEKWKLIELGFSIRYQPGIKVGDDLDFKRAYTAVFDELIENGLAVGHIEPGTEIPFMRDQFYGTLEYAARTIMLHGARKPDMDLAIEQLMHTFKRSYAATEIMPAADQVTSLSERLETAIARLEALAGPGEDGA